MEAKIEALLAEAEKTHGELGDGMQNRKEEDTQVDEKQPPNRSS